MGQIHDILVGIAMVLSAVFVPMAFFWRHHRRHLSPVFRDYCGVDGAVSISGDGADARLVCHAA